MNVAPNTYSRANYMQRRDSMDILQKYANRIKWRSDGNDTVLDIGTGTGDVTNDFILPILPKGFKKLIGVDILDEMVEAANKRYSNSKVSFEKSDMEGDVQDLLQRHPEGFDHIFSFFTLHWLHDPERAIQNIYKLLNPQGDCLLVFLGQHDFLDIEKVVISMAKWANIVPSQSFSSVPYHFHEDRVDIFRKLLCSTGFKSCNVVGDIRKYTYKSLQQIQESLIAVNSNMKHLTSSQKVEFFRDHFNIAGKMGRFKENDDPSFTQFETTYTLMIAYAEK